MMSGMQGGMGAGGDSDDDEEEEAEGAPKTLADLDGEQEWVQLIETLRSFCFKIYKSKYTFSKHKIINIFLAIKIILNY
jgi:hypothetical protein